jgi:probable phosphoglycerate mutase
VEIVLVRHGRTAANAGQVIAGVTDVPLDDVGRAQAASLAQSGVLGRFDRLVCSPLLRARETAAALGAPVVEAAWIEMHQGELEGLAVAEARARYADVFARWASDPAGTTLPGGESFRDVLGRARAAWDALAADMAATGATRAVVVSHQLVIAALSADLAGEPVEAWRRFTVPNTGWRRWRRAGAGWREDGAG